VNKINALAVLIASTLAGVDPASAASLSAEVTSELSPVTWSSVAQPTYAQYRVTITNNGTANISGLRLVGATSVIGGSGTATFYPASSDASCVATNAGQTSVQCSFPLLNVGNSIGPFFVTFNAPADGTRIDFAWQAVFNEGVPPGSSGDAGTVQAPALAAPNPDAVTSIVPANTSALTFFTGGGIATGVDTWVTRVKVPANISVATKAKVIDAVTDVPLASNLLTLGTSTLTIPNTSFCAENDSNFREHCLEVTLVRDASTIAKGAKIDSARIYYQKTDAEGNPILSHPLAEVPACDATLGVLPSAGQPCEDRAQRFAYPTRNKPKAPIQYDTDALGDWRFVIYARDNGRYAE
jgi:hypothetical protein